MNAARRLSASLNEKSGTEENGALLLLHPCSVKSFDEKDTQELQEGRHKQIWIKRFIYKNKTRSQMHDRDACVSVHVYVRVYVCVYAGIPSLDADFCITLGAAVQIISRGHCHQGRSCPASP